MYTQPPFHAICRHVQLGHERGFDDDRQWHEKGVECTYIK